MSGGYPLHDGQWDVFTCKARHRYVVCGRGWGKTHEGLAEVGEAATDKQRAREGMEIVYVGPSYRQTKAIAWKRLKAMFPRNLIRGKPHETDLALTLKWGPTIRLMGSDNLNISRGMDIHFLVLDEFAFQKEGVWEVAEGCLRTQLDRALIITTPNGPNHAFELWQSVQNDPEWQTFQKPTWDNPFHDAKGLERRKQRLARVVFDQEYGASFAALKGAIYGDFSVARNVRPVEIIPNGGEVFIGQDFNAGNINAVVGQRVGDAIHIVDEIITRTHIYDHIDALQTYMRRKGLDHRAVPVYVDSSGEYNATSKQTSDNVLMRKAGFRTMHDKHNPAVIDRIHSVQSLILNGAGTVRLLVNGRCAELQRCLLNQKFNQYGKPDKLGGLDHLPDALGYAVWAYFPIRPNGRARAV